MESAKFSNSFANRTVMMKMKITSTKNTVLILYSYLVDAFVAMGGGPETEGFIMKDAIVNIIKNEFELDFDIEEFI